MSIALLNDLMFLPEGVKKDYNRQELQWEMTRQIKNRKILLKKSGGGGKQRHTHK